MTVKIQDNTFAAACVDQNTVAQLEEALTGEPDAADMATWGLTADEWRAQIVLALAAKGDVARTLLEDALAATGCSLRAFAEDHMIRDERTVRRWRSGETPIPEVAQRRMRVIVREGK